MNKLEEINMPSDLKKLTVKELEQLAEEIRQELIAVTSKNGGHLAPNLGVVELTLALHYMFDVPKDKIVWDVGHQSYVHKILTGRKDEFSTLRQYGGLSGFPKISESDCDAFGVGHSSTSISAALGLAAARDLKGEDHHVIAVIGDGAMTGGMAYEALNHAGDLKNKLLVILNDNTMSIDQNVGALSDYLTKARSDKGYVKSKEDVEELLKKIPTLGDKMVKVADKLKDSLKYLLVPGTIFEELGFKYFGPINGHDLPDLLNILKNVKEFNRPVLLHIVTEKGRGYAPAVENPDRFHGVGPFDIQTGEVLKKSTIPSYTDVFAKNLIRLAKEDDSIVAITAAMGSGTGVNKFAKEFPNRSFDVGIAEEHAVTFAAGMAVAGLKPVVAVYSTFLQRAYDQILHDVALQKAPVVFALDRAGLVGDDGATHHGVFDMAFLRNIPNMVLMAPKDENELGQMLESAFAYQCPVAIRFPRGSGIGVELKEEYDILELGKGEVLTKGEDIVLFAIGTMVAEAQKAAELLKEDGINATVVNARFAKPLDKDLIKELAKEHKLFVTLEEGVLAGGFGSGVLELLENIKTPIEVLRIGIEDEFVPHGATDILKEKCNLDSKSIYERIKNYRGANNG